MKINHERLTREWSVEIDGKDYRVVYGSHTTPGGAPYTPGFSTQVIERPPRFYQHLDIYSRVGIHAGAKQLDERSPVYKKVQRALIEHLGGWPS
jgi:hypothetical protein